MDTYKWDSPYEWLASIAREWGTKTLFITPCVVWQARSTQIHSKNIFQQKMDEDGYFKKEED